MTSRLSLTREQAMAIAKCAWANDRAVDVEHRYDGHRTQTYVVQHGTRRRWKVSLQGRFREITAWQRAVDELWPDTTEAA